MKFLQLRALCNSKLNRAVCSVRLVSVLLLVNSVVLVVGIRVDDTFQNHSNVGLVLNGVKWRFASSLVCNVIELGLLKPDFLSSGIRFLVKNENVKSVCAK